ncbi:hypothetical protein K1W69_21585 [Hoeflea sp. WL0058]|uniref:Uncharacterized protein n=1 Tax=Flavimaribacter sediminis TaxID=2865987 RepID=A0AAE3D3G8_9HYPH|nr:hypothetical protein [Flavimaribacter sediminis]MBW8639801.1 hypothetical protein [Flavimaribacter sediminis]
MDVKGFLDLRLKFIRDFYDTAAAPFNDVMEKIGAGEAPYEPPYSEDEEPPYLSEWINAQSGLDVLGRACVSMLSASLKLYFKTWEVELDITWQDGERKKLFKNGFLWGYIHAYTEVLGLNWDKCPADLDILEQVTLARNRDQHPETISKMDVDYAPADTKKHPSLFFVTEWEQRAYQDSDLAGITWLNPSVHVSREALWQAIDEVAKLSGWL